MSFLIPENYLTWIDSARGIIFDCDGTLVDSMPIHFLAWYKTMQRYGMELPEDRFYALGGMPSHRIIELLAAEQSVTVDAVHAAHEKEQAFLDLIHLLKPIEPVMAVAREHRGRKPIAVASGGFRRIIHHQLELVECINWFDAIVTAEDTQRHKPEPDVFLEAARRLGVNASECIVFEDADLGVEAAKRAGMKCIDVREFYQPIRIPIL
ncbi:MAG: HAD family phosphatase [Pirellula sp.]|nr:HAD family phosphatase [Pirellula sp.]